MQRVFNTKRILHKSFMESLFWFCHFWLTAVLVLACDASLPLHGNAGSPPRRPTACHCLRHCCTREPEWIAAPARKWAQSATASSRPQNCCLNRPRCPCCPTESCVCPHYGAATASCCWTWVQSRPASTVLACPYGFAAPTEAVPRSCSWMLARNRRAIPNRASRVHWHSEGLKSFKTF